MRNPKRIILLFSFLIQILFWISLGTGIIDPLFNDSSHRIGKGGDFFQFYQAGSDLLSGDSIYQTENKKLKVPYGALYKYPPLLACTVGIISQPVSPWSAYKIWIIIIGCAFVIMLFFIKAIVPADDFLPVLCFSLVFTPYYLDLYHGQTNTVMAMLIAMVMYGFLKKRSFLSFAALCVSLNIKLMTVLLIPVYLSKKNWKKLLLTLLVSVCFFFPYFLFFKSDLSFFIRYVFGFPVGYFYQAGNLGIYPFLRDILSFFTYNKEVILSVQSLWILCVLAVSVFIHIYSKKRDSLDLVVLWICTFFVAFKFVWEHHFVMLIPVLAVEYTRNNKRSIGFLWLLFALPTMFYFLDIDLGGGYTEVQSYWSDSTSFLYHSSKILPMLIFYSLVVLRLFGRKLMFNKTLGGYLVLFLLCMSVYFFKPVSARDYHVLARLCLREGKEANAKKYFDKSIQKNRYYIDGYIDYIRFLHKSGDIDRANYIFQKARIADPENKLFR